MYQRGPLESERFPVVPCAFFSSFARLNHVRDLPRVYGTSDGSSDTSGR
jgi:hypothetical protein